MDILREKWQQILITVKEEHDITPVAFKTWLAPLEVFAVADRIITILVPIGQVGIDYITKKYMFPLKVAIAEYVGREYELEFLTPEQAADPARQPVGTIPKNAANPSLDSAEKAGLNPRYTFDTFVVGNNNKFAHAASLAVAESPGNIYNPLFIYGGAGLGKTHLMHSIAHYILKQDPRKRVIYVTSETFTNEVIDSIRNGNTNAMTKLREKYRNVDVLLIDDIQFIIGKESTQEEFFHTFNELHNNKKQIIISSDKPPKEIETLEARLRSRFEWGLIADISAPDFETRMAILHKKEELDGYNIDVEVIRYIATNIKSNIRELEGALNKLIAFSRLENREITVELAEESLRDIISPDIKREITPELILATIVEHFHVSEEDIKGTKRSKEIVFPRQLVMYLCLTMTNAGTKRVGKIVARDHTTIIHGRDKIIDDIKSSESTRNIVEILKQKITSG